MKRPFSATILLWLVLSLSVWGGLRFATAVQWWHILQAYTSPPGPLYIAISGGVGFLLGLILLWGMWQAKEWIRYALISTGASFIVWYWCDRLFLQPVRTDWLFALFASIAFLLTLVACVFAPGTKTFLIKREAHD